MVSEGTVCGLVANEQNQICVKKAGVELVNTTTNLFILHHKLFNLKDMLSETEAQTNHFKLSG